MPKLIWFLLLGSAFAQINNPSSSGNLLYQVNPQLVPAAPTVTCAGACAGGTWTYKYLINDAYGNVAAISAGGSATNATTLTGTNKNTIPCPATFTTFDGNVATCNVYRTATAGTPANLSLVCTGLALGATCTDDGSVNTASATPGSYVGTGAALTVFSYTLPANRMAAGKCVVLRASVNHNVGSANVNYTYNYGGSASSNMASASATVLAFPGMLCNTPGTTGTQNLSGNLGASGVTNALAIDSTTSQAITFAFNVAATDAVKPTFFELETVQ